MDSYNNPSELLSALADYSINFEDCPPLPDIETIASEAGNLPIRTDSDKARTEPNKTNKKPFFTAIGGLVAKPHPPDWLIKDYFECDKTVLIAAPSGIGKTFLVLDMGLSIAAGVEWQGHQTKQGAVFYVCGEGKSGIMKRAMAWANHNHVSLENVPFFISDSAVILPNKDSIEKLHRDIEASGHKPALIIFDTLARCLDGDENTAKDIGAFIQALDAIRTRYNSTMLVVHHSGKDESRGARGSSAIKGALDTEIMLTNPKIGAFTLSVTKQKDHDTPKDKSFKFESVATNWLDDDMNIIYSAVLVSYETEPQRKARKLNANPKKMLDVLRTAIDDGIEPTEQIKNLFKDEPKKCPEKIITVKDWQALAYEVMTVVSETGDDDEQKERKKKEALRKQFKRGLDSLEDYGYIGLLGDYVWLAYVDW